MSITPSPHLPEHSSTQAIRSLVSCPLHTKGLYAVIDYAGHIRNRLPRLRSILRVLALCPVRTSEALDLSKVKGVALLTL